MNLLNAELIEKSHGGRPLFTNLTIGIEEGEKIALIGENGCGKTTLMRILAGLESADMGNVTRNKLCRMSFLDQQSRANPDNTVIEHILTGNNPRAAALRRYEVCSEKCESGDEQALAELARLSDEMEHLGAWDYERQVHSVLQGVSESKIFRCGCLIFPAE